MVANTEGGQESESRETRANKRFSLLGIKTRNISSDSRVKRFWLPNWT